MSWSVPLAWNLNFMHTKKYVWNHLQIPALQPLDFIAFHADVLATNDLNDEHVHH